VVAIAMIVGIVAVTVHVVPLILGRTPRRVHLSAIALVGRFLLLMLLFPPVVLAHELGHALVGTLAGWRLQSLFVGPWRFVREGARMRIVWHRSFFYYGGAAVVTPREWTSDERIRRAFRQMVAGGPLASLLLAFALTALLAATHGGAWRFYVMVAATMSFAIGVGTLVPIRQTNSIRNDGLQLFLSRPRDRAGNPRPLDPGIRLGALVLMLTERRPREWSVGMVETLAASPLHQRQMFEYYRALDTADASSARDILQSTIDRVAAAPGVAASRARQDVALEAATFEAAWRRDLRAARDWLAIGEPALRWDPHGVWIARAAIHAAANEQPEARHALAEAERNALRRMTARVDLLRAPLIERIRMLLK